MSGPSYRPWELREFADDVEHLSLEEFTERHGAAFLLFSGSLADLDPTGYKVDTGKRTRKAESEAPEAEFLVFPLRTSGRSLGTSIRVGRAATNDVVINDRTVSNRHCTFAVEGHRIFVKDDMSANGTRCNGKPVTRTLKETRSGDKIELGSLQVNLMTAPHFVALVAHLSPTKAPPSPEE